MNQKRRGILPTMGATEGRGGLCCCLPAIGNNKEKKKTNDDNMKDYYDVEGRGVIWDCDWSKLW